MGWCEIIVFNPLRQESCPSHVSWQDQVEDATRSLHTAMKLRGIFLCPVSSVSEKKLL